MNKFEWHTGESPEQALDTMSSDEILGQLNISAKKYEKVADELREGNLSDIGYAEEMERNLADHRSMLVRNGMATPQDKEVLDKVTDRLSTLRDLLKTARTSH